MDELLRFLEKLEEYRCIESEVNKESDNIPYPSEGQMGLWQAKRNLNESFRKAVTEALRITN